MAAPPVLVQYWCPGDSDDVEHPNAFPVPSKGGRGLQLRDIRARFPLPGSYHFRFKMKWEQGAVWMDVTNEDSTVPMFEDKIYAKVLRISWGDTGPTKGAADKAALHKDTPAARPVQQPPPPPVHQTAPAPQGDMLGFDAPKQVAPAGNFGPGPPGNPGRPQRASTAATDDFDMLFS